MGSSPQPSGFALGLWWASQVVGDTTMTSILVSIPITPNQRCIIKWLGYQQTAIHYHKHICNIVANRSQVMSTSLPEASIFLMAKQSHPIWLSNYIPHGNTMNIEIPVSGTEGLIESMNKMASCHSMHTALMDTIVIRNCFVDSCYLLQYHPYHSNCFVVWYNSYRVCGKMNFQINYRVTA